MIKIKNAVVSLLMIFCCTCAMGLSSVQAGGYVSKMVNKSGTVVLVNDARPGTKVTFFWHSGSQTGNGVCHKEEVMAGNQASYTYTPEQLIGNRSITAIIEFAPDCSKLNMVQMAHGPIGDQSGVIISLSHMLNFGHSAYVSKEDAGRLLALNSGE